MADAEVIPLGTRGKPGRGSGSKRPSAAARTLAGRGPRSVPGARRDPVEQRDGRPDGDSATGTAPRRKRRAATRTPADPVAGTGAAPNLEREPQPGPQADAGPDARPDARPDPGRAPGRAPEPEPEPEPEPGPTAERIREGDPEGGIPVRDWVSALTSAAREVFGERWEPRVAELLALARRRVTGDYEVDEFGFDVELTERFLLAAVRPLADKWFRVEVRGADNIPADGGALVVSNHSGTVPMDGLMTMVSVKDTTGRNLRPLGADLVFRMPFLGELARKGGVTLACNEDAERMLSGGELVGVWPEGYKGIGKPYSQRYKLQRFGRGGFVSAALRTGVPIVPCSVVGAEEIYPLVGNIPALARLVGLPYLPITPFFPLLGPLGLVPLPSKWLIEFGEPIRTDTFPEGAADDPMLVFNVTDQVRETVQQTLYSLLMQRRSVFY
jgi:1-acyl-sn-glycerol-3-phosphate acyltransferase